MPKKKVKTKESSAEYVFDYRYTPKPYFTAPLSSASSSGLASSGSNLAAYHQKPSSHSQPPNAWQNSSPSTTHRGSKHGSYAKVSQSKGSPSSRQTDGQARLPSTQDNGTRTISDSDKDRLLSMFVEMFGSKIDPGVVEIILQEANWNESVALDNLEELIPQDDVAASSMSATAATGDDSESGIPYSTASGVLTEFKGYSTTTPDHMLTPTAPTLSYCSSMTSLDEYTAGVCTEVTQRNLSQAADALRNNGTEHTNDLDRQKRARSRATTPRSVIRNGSLTTKNISLMGSTESLESNRSHDPSSLHYKSTTLSRVATTPKKTNFDKSMSLVDISASEDKTRSLSLSLPRNRQDLTASLDSARSDPGNMPLTIPIEYGDIVLERTSAHNPTSDDLQVPVSESDITHPPGQLHANSSIADYSQAISSLTNQIESDHSSSVELPASDVTKSAPDIRFTMEDAESPMTSSSGSDGIVITAHSERSDSHCSTPSPDPQTGSVDKTTPIVTGSRSSDQVFSYNGLLNSGTVVPTAIVAARPKTRPVKPPTTTTTVCNVTSELRGTALSGDKIMFILRGAPGSGKSTLAKDLLADTDGQVFSSDIYFYNEKGEYVFDAKKLADAHHWNQNRVRDACERGITPVVADNTNTQAWEMEPYVKICLHNGYRPILAEPQTNWRYKAKELSRKNTHDVPYQEIKRMLERFEHDITADQIIDRLVKREPLLASMATQIKAPSTDRKLSRKKLVSKTIKRNRQTETVEKIKDKQVGESSFLAAHDDDKSGETEIMYPSIAAMKGLNRKPTVKVINRDIPKAKPPPEEPKLNGIKIENGVLDSPTLETNINDLECGKTTDDKMLEVGVCSKNETGQISVGSENVTDTEVKQNLLETVLTTDDSNQVVDKEVTTPKSDIPVENTLSAQSPDTVIDSTTEALKTEIASAAEPDQIAAPEVAEPEPESIKTDDTIDIDTIDIETTEAQNTQSSISQSNEIEVTHIPISVLESTDPDFITPPAAESESNSIRPPTAESESSSIGPPPTESESSSIRPPTAESQSSNTLPRARSHSLQTSTLSQSMTHSQTMPPKTKRSNRPKSTSSQSLLNISQKDKLLSKEWEIPPYPVPKSAADPATPPHTCTPPPPYDDVSLLAAEVPKQKDQWTITDPSDYAIAYKAMQRNEKLPEGWRLVLGHAIPPFSPTTAVLVPRYTDVLMLDKGTSAIIDDSDLSDETTTSSENREATVKHLQSCFPKLSRTQLAEFLDLCGGDETWATNLLLDSNRVAIPKAKKQLKCTVNGPECVKRTVKPKFKQGRSQMVKKFKSFMPASTCLGQTIGSNVSYKRLRSDTVDLTIAKDLCHQLHHIYGADSPPPNIGSDSLTVSVPKWIVHRFYRCMLEAASDAPAEPITVPSSSASNSSITVESREQSIPSTPASQSALPLLSPTVSDRNSTDLPSHQTTSDMAQSAPSNQHAPKFDLDFTWPNDTDLIKADEALARRLHAEEVLSLNSRVGSTNASFSDIVDEQLAVSMTQSHLSSQSNDDMAAKVKRQQLYSRYPDSDKAYLEEVFQSFSYNLEDTMKELDQHHHQSSSASVSAFMSGFGESQAASSSRESTPRRQTDSSSNDMSDEHWLDVEDVSYSPYGNDAYQKYRAEAHALKQQKDECMRKSRVAREKREFRVCSYYSQMAATYDDKMQDAHRRAALCILQDKNYFRSDDTVDLHGLHPQEVNSVVGKIINMKRSEGKLSHLYFITGKGNNSKGGVAKLKPMVAAYLKQHAISHQWQNEGMVRIRL